MGRRAIVKLKSADYYLIAEGKEVSKDYELYLDDGDGKDPSTQTKATLKKGDKILVIRKKS